MRTSTRKTERPKWNVGNFSTNSDVPVNFSVAQPFNNIYVALAQGLGRVGDITNTQGRAIDRAFRFLDIGGIVMTCGFVRSSPLVTEDSLVISVDELDMIGQQLLVVDRLDATGAPLSVGYDWGLSTPPTTNTTGNSSTNEQQDQPTRILKRWGGYVRNTVDLLSITSSTYVPVGQEVTNHRWSYNLRLKLRLGPEHGLFLANHVRRVFPSNAELNIDRSLRFWAFGTIYYKWSVA